MKTPILIIMFTRYTTLEKVFEQVKKAKPESLYLYQDGPREDKYDEDMEGIKRCRKIVSDIDWPCKVVTNYQERNIGCDPGSFYAYKWFFSNVEKGIILEDDAEASESFFKYCEELLDYYENDKKVYRICGQNIEGKSKTNDSYLFSRKGATGSWATWRRVAEMWDESYDFLDDTKLMATLKDKFENDDCFYSWRENALWHKSTGKAYYETLFYENKLINDMLDVIPACNLVTNIGLTGDAVHNKDAKMMSRALKKCFDAPRYELVFPLKHPDKIIENMHYTDSVNRIMGWGHPFLRFVRKWETRLRRFIYGDKTEKKKLLNKIIRFRG